MSNDYKDEFDDYSEFEDPDDDLSLDLDYDLDEEDEQEEPEEPKKKAGLFKREKKKKEKKRKKDKTTKTTNRKKAFSDHTILGIGIIIAAILIYFVVEPMMNGVIGSQVDVARVKTTIYAGEKITEDKIEMVKVNSGSIPANAIRNKKDAVGKFTDSKLVAGDYIMSEKTKDSQFGDGIYMNGLDGTKRIMSIAVPNFATGLSAKIASGDIITIMAPPTNDSEKAVTYNELKYVKVLAVTLPSGVDGSENTEGKTELPSSITVLVNDQQAQLLVALNATGKMHIILAYRGDEDVAQKFLDEQDSYFSSGITK